MPRRRATAFVAIALIAVSNDEKRGELRKRIKFRLGDKKVADALWQQSCDLPSSLNISWCGALTLRDPDLLILVRGLLVGAVAILPSPPLLNHLVLAYKHRERSGKQPLLGGEEERESRL